MLFGCVFGEIVTFMASIIEPASEVCRDFWSTFWDNNSIERDRAIPVYSARSHHLMVRLPDTVTTVSTVRIAIKV